MRKCLLMLGTLALVPLLAAGEPAAPAEDGNWFAKADFGPFGGLSGTYEIRSTWAGKPFHGQTTFTPILDGNFIEATTRTKNDDGDFYVRYRTIYAANERGEVTSHGFTFEGLAIQTKLKVRASQDKAMAYRSTWDDGSGVALRQEIIFDLNQLGCDSFGMKVWAGRPESDEWIPVMDGRWVRVEDDLAGD